MARGATGELVAEGGFEPPSSEYESEVLDQAKLPRAKDPRIDRMHAAEAPGVNGCMVLQSVRFVKRVRYQKQNLRTASGYSRPP